MNLALPINKQATKIIRTARCETCKYAEREQGPKPVYSCHKNPPGVCSANATWANAVRGLPAG